MIELYNIYTSASVLDLYGTTYNIAWIYDFKDDVGLYCDDSLIVLWERNEQHIDKIRKNIKNAFKMIGFPIEIKTNLHKVIFPWQNIQFEKQCRSSLQEANW